MKKNKVVLQLDGNLGWVKTKELIKEHERLNQLSKKSEEKKDPTSK